MPGPLSHVRVLDLSRVLAGPWAAQNLADLGAEVIKVERPGTGDDTRGWGPPWLHDAEGHDTRESAYYASVNRNKKSVTLDLSKPEGQAIVRQLAAKCDVVIENYKVGTLEALWPRLRRPEGDQSGASIYCSVTGFGQDGPHAQRPGYDFIFQGMGGLMSITGERDGQPGAGPMRVGIAITDVMTGMYASLAIAAALAHRERTGAGQYIDLALLDTIVAFNANQIVGFLSSGRLPQRWGNAHPQVVPYEVFATADGHIILAVGNDGQFRRFCAVAGCPELAEEARFATNSQRILHRAELIPIVAEVMRTRTKHEWIDALEARQRALRPDQQPAGGVRGSTGPPSRPAHRHAARARRRGARGGEPDAALGDTGRVSHRAAAARPAQRRGLHATCSARARPNSSVARRGHR